MDMDIALEELELLEANSHFEEEYLDFNPPEEDDDDFINGEPQPILPTPQSLPKSPVLTENLINGQKRPRAQTPDPSNHEDNGLLSGEKRTKIDNLRPEIEVEDEEDWLRYSPPKQSNSGIEVEEVEIPEEKILSRYASEIDGDCIPITAPGGERVYAKICWAENEDWAKKLDVKAQPNELISEPIDILLQKAEQEAFTKVLQASSGGQSDVVALETPVIHEQLWVDKYSPNSFTELLSDEQTNREVLSWLKQWDTCVFGSEIRSTSDDVLSSLRRHTTTAQHRKLSDSNFSWKNQGQGQGQGWSNGSSKYSKNLDHRSTDTKDIQDSWSKKPRLTGLPEQKILLLCGAPGLGKTTLAHVAAKHCGYDVVEVNASDERSSSAIEGKILDVVQMNSVTPDSRPRCLVIDEIDGALGDGKGAVEVLVKMVSAEKKSDAGKENTSHAQSGRSSSKKGRKSVSLSRPVICICNDLYAPALRPLRQIAKVHIFVQPTVSRVVSRVKYICNKEGMTANSLALTGLAEYTECDIRSCLNTLQFLNKKKEKLNSLDVGSQVVGRKDISRSVFEIWKEIFQKKKKKQARRSNDSCRSMSNEFDFLHTLISNRGDYDVIFDGIHENIFQLQYHDPLMQKTVKCLNSLGISDLLHRYIMRTQKMSLYVYNPALAVSVHHIVAQIQKPNIEWPKSYQRYRTTLIDKMDILRSWHYKMPPLIGRYLSTKSFVEDSISPLLHILSPSSLRPVALHLLSDKDKNDLSQLVGTMVSYSITYKNMKSDPLASNLGEEAALDVPTLSFDPPIHDFIKFKGYRSSHHVLALAMKQVLVHEIEKQKILQVSTSKQDSLGKENSMLVPAQVGTPVVCAEILDSSKNSLTARTGNQTASSSLSTSGSSRSPMTSIKLKSSGDVKKPSSRSSNYFDRFRKSNKGSENTDNVIEKTERDSRPILFKFNEGFTNAVKRPVRMREFL